VERDLPRKNSHPSSKFQTTRPNRKRHYGNEYKRLMRVPSPSAPEPLGLTNTCTGYLKTQRKAVSCGWASPRRGSTVHLRPQYVQYGNNQVHRTHTHTPHLSVTSTHTFSLITPRRGHQNKSISTAIWCNLNAYSLRRLAADGLQWSMRFSSNQNRWDKSGLWHTVWYVGWLQDPAVLPRRPCCQLHRTPTHPQDLTY